MPLRSVAGRCCCAVALGALCLGLQGCEQDTVSEQLPTGTPEVRMTPVPVAPIGVVPGGLRPTPVPTPSGGSDPEGPSDPTSDNGADIPNNSAPVADVGAHVFFAECGGTVVDFPGYAPVGCRIHLDATAKDAARKPTRAKGDPVWSFEGDVGKVGVNSYTGYTPAVMGFAPASVTAWCTIDGVTSNPVSLVFK
jgi:hypothetical protein